MFYFCIRSYNIYYTLSRLLLFSGVECLQCSRLSSTGTRIWLKNFHELRGFSFLSIHNAIWERTKDFLMNINTPTTVTEQLKRKKCSLTYGENFPWELDCGKIPTHSRISKKTLSRWDASGREKGAAAILLDKFSFLKHFRLSRHNFSLSVCVRREKENWIPIVHSNNKENQVSPIFTTFRPKVCSRC